MRFSHIRRLSGFPDSANLFFAPRTKFGIMYFIAFAPTQVAAMSHSAIAAAAASASFPFTAEILSTVTSRFPSLETIVRG